MRQDDLQPIIARYVEELTFDGDIDEDDRQEAYLGLFNNGKMMRVLQNMVVADTKEMMVRDCLGSEFERGARWGMFMRAKAIYDKARELAAKEIKK